jgi:Tfp pilus assembly protein PilX
MEKAGHMKFPVVFGASNALGRMPGTAQRGMTLIIALIMLVAMTLSGIALVRSVDTTAVIAGNMAFKQGTLMATDVGVEAASQVLIGLVDNAGTTDNDAPAQNYSASYDPELAVPTQLTAATANPINNIQNTGNTARFWMERMCLATGPATATNCILEPGSTSLYYRVTTRVDGPRGTVAITQSTIQSPGDFVPQQALLTGGKVTLSGTTTMSGTAGNVHSNTRIEASGTVTLSGTASAVGSNADSGGTQGVSISGTFTGGITENAAAIAIPVFDPSDYKQYADFWLRSDGSVINRLGETLMTVAQGQAGNLWLGWKYTAVANAIPSLPDPYTQADINKLATWELTNNNSYSTGLLYVEGHAKVVSAPGNGSNGPAPWVISLLATGNIRMNDATFVDYRAQSLPRWARVTGQNPPPNVPTKLQLNLNPAVLPWPLTPVITQTPQPTTNALTPITVQNLGLVAGLDLYFDGTGIQTGSEALFTAREQVRIGNYTLRGPVIASDQYSIGPDITENLVNGTANIFYGGGLVAPVVVGIARRVSWRVIQ